MYGGAGGKKIDMNFLCYWEHFLFHKQFYTYLGKFISSDFKIHAPPNSFKKESFILW